MSIQDFTNGVENAYSSRNATDIGSFIMYPFEGKTLLSSLNFIRLEPCTGSQVEALGISQPGQGKVAVSVSIDNGNLFMSLIKLNNLSYSIANYSYVGPVHLIHGRHFIFINVAEMDGSRAFEFQRFYIETKAVSSEYMFGDDDKDRRIGCNTNCPLRRRADSGTITIAALGSIVGIALLLLAIFCIRKVWSRKLASFRDNLRIPPEISGSSTSLSRTGNELELITHKSPRIARSPEVAT